MTLDPDVARMLREEAHRQRRSFKELVNDALRRGLSPRRGTRAAPYRVKPHHTRLLPGFDRMGFNRLVDELEDAATAREGQAPWSFLT